MPSCFEEAISALYIGVTGRFRLTYEDRAIETETNLTRLQAQLDRREALLQDQLRRLRAETLAARPDRARCRSKLMELRRMRLQHEQLIRYRDIVQQHLEALHSTELNKTLISTLQESSKTLKSMGIVDGVRQAENVVQDVEASMQQVHELTSVLGAPLSGGAIVDGTLMTDQELEMELMELMATDAEEDSGAAPAAQIPLPPVSPPAVVVSSMSPSTSVAAVRTTELVAR